MRELVVNGVADTFGPDHTMSLQLSEVLGQQRGFHPGVIQNLADRGTATVGRENLEHANARGVGKRFEEIGFDFVEGLLGPGETIDHGSSPNSCIFNGLNEFAIHFSGPSRRECENPLMHPFDHAVQLDPIAPDTMRGHTHPEWANMVGPFGGITAAALLKAIEIHPDRTGEPVALTVNFAAPIADGDFDITLRAARTNRTNQHWLLDLSQQGDVKTTATALFGVRRETWADSETRPASVPGPETIADGTFITGASWSRLYDMRFVDGALPADGQESPSSTTTLWVRDAQARPLDYPALAAVCDVFFPRIFLRRGGPLPAGTISLTTYFHTDRELLDSVGGDFVLATAHANRFSRGFFDQSANLFSRDGRLLATSHQVVYFKG